MVFNTLYILFAASLNFPVVLIHGFLDRSPEDGTLGFAHEFLSRMGVEHFTAHIPAYGSIEERSISLIKQIATNYPQRSVHLFGHSMVREWLSRQSDSSHALYRGESMPETSLPKECRAIWASEWLQ